MPIPFVIVLGALLLAVFNVISWTAFWITTGVVVGFVLLILLFIIAIAAIGVAGATRTIRSRF